MAARLLTVSALCAAGELAPETSEVPQAENSEQCLLQKSRVASLAKPLHVSQAHLHEKVDSTSEAYGLSWTTNVGQENHLCSGSRFEVDFTGTHNGMVVNQGMLLKKGQCTENTKRPVHTQAVTCEDEATGCHMWCSPVFHSYYDTKDWFAFDSRCKHWDGSTKPNDKTCEQTGKMFTWARSKISNTKNRLDLTFAILSGCDHYCSPMWVTIYDPKNWGKFYRWCFNRRNDWGTCDDSEEVSLMSWQSKQFKLSQFQQKHGYTPESFSLELAVYAEMESAEILINHLSLSTVRTRDTAPVVEFKGKTCGSDQSCGSEHKCCRKQNSEVDAKCCPKAWTCCEDSCCPWFYTCAVTAFGHTCKPPTDDMFKKPALCSA